MTETVYLSLGSNIGERILYLEKALKDISLYPETRIKDISYVYETEPVGLEDKQAYFLNLCFALDTSLNPFALLRLTQETEEKLGRHKVKKKTDNSHRKYLSRVIDIDILIFGDRIIYTKELIIPHPKLHERGFVLEPLCDIAGNITHPLLQLKIKTLKNTHEDKHIVKRLNFKFSMQKVSGFDAVV